MRPQEHPFQLMLQELSTDLERARPGPRAPPRTLHPPVPFAPCLAAYCQHASSRTISPSNPEWRSCVPPRCCLALRTALLMPEPQAWLGLAGLPSTASSLKVCFPSSCAPQSLQPAPLSCFPSCAATVGFFAVGQNRATSCPSAGAEAGGFGRWMLQVGPTARLPLPAPLPLGQAWGDLVLCASLRAIRPF